MSSTSALAPRDRLLRTASRLFYAEGLHTVGVDRLVSEAGVTRATFYRHFPAKEELIVAYLRGRSQEIRAAVAQIPAHRRGREALLGIMQSVAEDVRRADFRGCAFLNAAAEYPDPAHPVRVAVEEHHAWFFQALRDQAAEAGHIDPDHTARLLVLLRDGALQGGALGNPDRVCDTLLRAVNDLLAAAEPTGGGDASAEHDVRRGTLGG
ncbi:TetR/AcrR family transcriptional regulator [Micromonospora phytophila]|uniref:TetR/AcrR family transcriptional regulator n=1 Tax=Micromonospora phytophila TaxID=709888 RepID=UPI002030A2B3|nr:TetR/AcrR family transcriptional regulator [Micromonospora phytophila]MCM0673706.1 TetR/AcrR family transcriptional regulator [Micromonospora phytophila]